MPHLLLLADIHLAFNHGFQAPLLEKISSIARHYTRDVATINPMRGLGVCLRQSSAIPGKPVASAGISTTSAIPMIWMITNGTAPR